MSLATVVIYRTKLKKKTKIKNKQYPKKKPTTLHQHKYNTYRLIVTKFYYTCKGCIAFAIYPPHWRGIMTGAKVLGDKLTMENSSAHSGRIL